MSYLDQLKNCLIFAGKIGYQAIDFVVSCGKSSYGIPFIIGGSLGAVSGYYIWVLGPSIPILAGFITGGVFGSFLYGLLVWDAPII